MIDSTILLFAGIAGVVAILATVAIERLGGRVGGVIGSTPSTLVPAAMGMWAGGDVAHYQAAICMVPVGMVVNGLFLWTWRVVPPRLPDLALGPRLALMTVISLTTWFAAAAALITGAKAVIAQGTPPMAVGVIATAVCLGLGLSATWTPLPAPKGTRRVPLAVLLSRGVLAAIAIAVAITVSRQGQPLIAGVATVFPAIFLTTMVSLWVSQGAAVPAGAVGPIILGATAPCVFALSSTWLFPALGSGWGALAAWLLCVSCVSVPVAMWLQRRSV